MKFKESNPELYQRHYRQLRAMMIGAGVTGLLEILADLSQELGDSPCFSKPDSFWLNTAAQIDECKEKVQKIP